MGTYLKSLNVISYDINKKKITVICNFELYANMTIDESKLPPLEDPINGNIILDFSILEDKNEGSGNISPLPPKDYTYTLSENWDSYLNHLTLVRLVNPTNTRDEESMETKDATVVS